MMNLSRKILFIIAAALLLTPIGIYLWWISPRNYTVLQGVTDAKSTQFVTIVGREDKVECFARESESNKEIKSYKQRTVNNEDFSWAVHKCQFSDLDLTKNYRLLVRDAAGRILAERSFRLLDPEKEKARIAIVSCSNDWYHIPRMWENMHELKPDLIFAIGDNVYADVNTESEVIPITPKLLIRRYLATWRILGLFNFDPLIPTIGLWDDHDFGANNSNSKFSLKKESKEIFHTFFAQEDDNEIFKNGPGVSSFLNAFGVKFLFLDGRTYRSEMRGPASSYFSVEQIQWVKDLLQKDDSPAWIISGSQFYGAPPVEETFEHEHPEGFESFKDMIRSTARKVFFVSGDTHFTELKAIGKKDFGYTTYEITSSGIHSLPLGVPGPDSRRLHAVVQPNFVLAEFNKENSQVIRIEAHGWFKEPLFMEEITFGKDDSAN